MSYLAQCNEMHKAIHRRIAARAAEHQASKKAARCEPNPKPEPKPEPIEDGWVDRQIEKYKDYWFSIASSRIKVAKSGAPTIREIQRAICEVYEVDLHDLLSARRTANIVIPRQVSMYLAKELTGLSLPRIARATGDRDHTTALHAIRKIKQLCKTDRELASKVDLLRERLS